MQTTFATNDIPTHHRRQFWQKVVSDIYYSLDLRFLGGHDFHGNLGAWSLGPVSISRNVCDGLLYKRHERHLVNEREECFLITVPELAEIRFEQDGKDIRCRPGAFLIERSHLPYEFSHHDPAALWVLKIPSAVLRGRISRPERLATLQFDASRSVGALFVDTLRLSGERIEEMDETARTMMGKHLIDLLAMAVESDERVLAGHSSTIRNAHLHRCEHFIRTHLDDMRLTPQTVADGCGISLRYLHQIFEGEGVTVSTYIRAQRLLMCDAMLRDPHCRKSISEIAYHWGFGDQAQFSRNYRGRFGCTPSEARAASRAANT
ncbi:MULTISPECIES: helix-turn-helix domain-containing protein [unclassified Bradyrhizobium]|uniref:AraC-like ligand-binding domain-containing protein n=1 Tax=unclassified Bradyrhizobium TaxID=2631580 RepID=UPI001BA9820E|nr:MULTISPECIES: helix-turn-helix domain-containing protein [unclassified Bradyrhizobium]MBR1225650.1 helix-turn-helix domain-containing protein [Bradyrhizobium sp. AUGA SZCCT0176]MBR1298161.1 helix-turn-helix domain-containing protein [Bradyrhizobium sp. AUGA SZCCT0042]